MENERVEQFQSLQSMDSDMSEASRRHGARSQQGITPNRQFNLAFGMLYSYVSSSYSTQRQAFLEAFYSRKFSGEFVVSMYQIISNLIYKALLIVCIIYLISSIDNSKYFYLEKLFIGLV